MRHRITFQVDATADGAEDPSYSDFLSNVPCDVRPVSGGERYLGKQLQAETTIAIVTRYYDNLTPNMRAVNDVSGAVYEISRMIDIDGRQRRYLIEATEVVV